MDQFRSTAYYKDLKEISAQEGKQILKVLDTMEGVFNKLIDKIPTNNNSTDTKVLTSSSA